MPFTVGVLALQGGVAEHLASLARAAEQLRPADGRAGEEEGPGAAINLTSVRTAAQLAPCDALVIPGGESTTMAIVADRIGLLDPLRRFVT